MSDDPRDVTAHDLKLEIVRVSSTGGIEARFFMRDRSGNILAGACMSPAEFRGFVEMLTREYQRVMGRSILY